MRARVLDLETTGFDATDKVIEYGSYDLDEETRLLGFGRQTLLDPGVPIPAHASAAHHIIDSDLAGKPTFEEFWASEEMEDNQEVDVFVAHNAKFEKQFITEVFTDGKPWICTYKVAMVIWPDAPGHSNQTLRYWLKPPNLIRKWADPAHRALPDAYTTAHILSVMLNHKTFAEMIAISSVPAILPKIRFGKFEGRPFSEVPRDYLQWVVKQKDMDEDVLHTARHWLGQ